MRDPIFIVLFSVILVSGNVVPAIYAEEIQAGSGIGAGSGFAAGSGLCVSIPFSLET